MSLPGFPKDCAVCLESLAEDSSEVSESSLKTPCNHIFHRKCLMVWITNGTPGNCCPLCKRPLQLTNNDQEVKFGRNPSYTRTSSSSSFHDLHMSIHTLMNGFQGNELDLIYRFQDLLCHDEPVIRSLAVAAFFLRIFLWLALVCVFVLCSVYFLFKLLVALSLAILSFSLYIYNSFPYDIMVDIVGQVG